MASVPVALRAVLAVVGVEALALVVGAVGLLLTLVTGTDNPGGVIFLALFALGVVAVLLGSARALVRGRRTGRAPVVTWQLLQVGVAVLLIQAGQWSGWLLLAVSVVVVLLMVSRPVVEHTVPR